ncbi:hypothetical protein BGX38DRAFT_1314649 [Terfezia claveryi]|nr:hypothetical protein BGX38DRAFT_1314649 [Terfezia claveryi]
MSRRSQGVNRQRTVTSYSFQEDTEGEDDEDTVLQPPHLALSSKRLAESDGGRPARKLRIDYGAPKTPRSAAHPSSSAAHPSSSAAHPSSSAAHPSSSRQRSSLPLLSTGRGQPRPHHTESSAGDMPSDTFSLNSEGHTQEEEELGLTIQKPPRVGPRSRLFFSVPDEYKELVRRATSHMRHYTLFGNPMLNAEEIQQLLSVTWVKAQEETGETLPRLKIASTHLHSIHSRTRSHLVYECKRSIVGVFGLDKLPQHEVAQRVSYLLFQDRFICREDGRETHQKHFRGSEITEIIFRKYFSTLKQRGNCDESFFDAINEVCICLVTSAMRHCLKAWMTGVYVEPPSATKFKYDSTVTMYQRFLATWNAHPRRVRMLLLAAIKADIRTRMAAAQQKGCLESDQPLEVGDTSAFEAELMQELLQATRAARVTRQRIPDAFHRQGNQGEKEDHSQTDVEAAEHETDNELEEETDDD